MIARKFTSFQELKDEEYRYWQGVSPATRIQAIYDHSVEMYKEGGTLPDGQQLKRTVIRFERACR